MVGVLRVYSCSVRSLGQDSCNEQLAGSLIRRGGDGNSRYRCVVSSDLATATTGETWTTPDGHITIMWGAPAPAQRRG